MRTMPNYLIILTFLLLIGLITIVCVGVYIRVRKQRNIWIESIHVSFIFGCLFFLSLFLQTIVLDLSIEKIYQHASLLFGLALSVSLALNFILYSYAYKKKLHDFYISIDIKNLLNSLSDSVLIYDYDGHIIDLNQAARLLKPYLESDDIDKCYNNTNSYEQFINGKWYIINTKLIHSTKGTLLGCIKVFHVIDTEKTLIKKLEESNAFIEQSNKKLIANLGIDDALESEKIRLKIIQEIQTLLVKKIEYIILRIHDFTIEGNSEHSYQHEINLIANELRNVLKTIRQSVQRMKEKDWLK